MPYVAPKASKHTTVSLNVKQTIAISIEVLDSKNINTKNKSVTQIMSTRDTPILKRENLTTSPRLTHTGNLLLQKPNGEIIKSSIKKLEIKSASLKQVRFSTELKQIIYDDDFSDDDV
ncbi:6645_t:CDS:1 [Dentiscutata erythropus]|uniref:6645_t:CDS:1 n=1 Tax=Dentiscutata erythropus TaxID=1348616 RepID=A0A9N9H0M1_9GLOM|nr:6645_t:CDS:1 [Dentiscutata erythropus]